LFEQDDTQILQKYKLPERSHSFIWRRSGIVWPTSSLLDFETISGNAVVHWSRSSSCKLL